MAEEEIPKESKQMQKYFQTLHDQIKKEYKVATDARKKGYDPEEKVDSPLAENMVERVEGLISAVAPQVIGSGVTKRIFELEKKYGVSDWRVSLLIAVEIAREKFCKFKDKREAMEVGIRTGFAYHTQGIVAAPLEGFIELEIKKRRDGKEYFAAKFSQPIRGAGGTAAAVCVIIVDYVRKQMGYEPYDPDEKEVNRYVTELNDYHDRVTNLQYHASEKEMKILAANVPVEVTGDPSEKLEVSNYKDLPRIPTNKIRGGLCLVMSMIALKAPKLVKRLEQWGKEFELEWEFMTDFLKVQKEVRAGKQKEEKEEGKLMPDNNFIKDLVAGRPVLTHPLGFGGFRLRYGRSRTSGYSSASIHPATMLLTNNYIAVGTQLKLERPSKAAAITVCDHLDGPIVKLKNGNVQKVKTDAEARKIRNEVKEILFLGDILFSYGDFSENGHKLIPAGYCEEWWVKEMEKSIVNLFGNLDKEKVVSLVNISGENLGKILKNPIKEIPTPQIAIQLSEKLEIPLHPYYTFYWKSLTKEDLLLLLDNLEKSKKEENKIILNLNSEIKEILDKIGMPHIIMNNEFAVIEQEYTLPLLYTLGLNKSSSEEIIKKVTKSDKKEILELINEVAEIKIRDKAGTFIGARMGRPEKAKMRKLTGSPHGLFPVGEEGDRLRCFQSALEKGKIRSNFALFRCKTCKKETIFSVCETCGKKTYKRYNCKTCGIVKAKDCEHEKPRYKIMDLDINYYFEACLKKLKTRVYPDLIKGVRGTSNKDHIPEHLIKAILRSKHDIYVNKDGSVRYDMIETPITHFKPKEIQTTIEKLKSMGYELDIHGKELVNTEQILELKPQDLILPACMDALDESANEVLYRVGQFIDELLQKLYGLKPFYNFKDKNDVIGTLVIGLAPHISSGTVGRVIGFSQTSGGYAHPLYHAALRRDCDGDEASVSLLLDSLLNFSRQYLPDRIGGRTMDAPLVLTAKVIPTEVDDMIHGMDVVWQYPLELYEAALEFKYPWDVDVEQENKRLNTWKQYEKIGFTHDTTSINQGVLCSAYKLLPSMREKLDGQMEIAEKIKAVKTKDVARLVIEKHFIKDIKGNLRKFSMQQFRCVKCNEKFRRPPMLGRCTKCGGKILFTISEGSVIKYLEPAMGLVKKYDLDPYLKQTIELVQRRVDEVFGKEKEIQEGLDKWFGGGKSGMA